VLFPLPQIQLQFELLLEIGFLPHSPSIAMMALIELSDQVIVERFVHTRWIAPSGDLFSFVAPRCSSKCITPINEARITPRSQCLEAPSAKGVVATFCVTTDSDDLLHSPPSSIRHSSGFHFCLLPKIFALAITYQPVPHKPNKLKLAWLVGSKGSKFVS